MEQEELYRVVKERIWDTFTPKGDEVDRIEKRLQEYSYEELQHFHDNFELFGVDEILKCLYDFYVEN